MRLLNTATLQLEEFSARAVPEYVILSHRWGDAEVSFKDYTKARFRPEQDGYKKIVECCKFAKNRDWDYVWIDTCCIDKRSSAELSEAINSMFTWYQAAPECYVYMADVSDAATEVGWHQEFRESSWFTRGWTLQELIASRTTVFCGKRWQILGVKLVADPGSKTWKMVKDLEVLNFMIAEITTIPQDVLFQSEELHTSCSVAQRMSWAAGRKTERVEDRAYSLLGIFDINMPLIYGEGLKAFRRLQQEIIRQSNDETIFAFDRNIGPSSDYVRHVSGENRPPIVLPDRTNASDYPREAYALLATSPDNYATSGNIVNPRLTQRTPYVLTNQGAEFRLRLGGDAWRRHTTIGEDILLTLGCGWSEYTSQIYWLKLQQQVCGHHVIVKSGFDTYYPPRTMLAPEERKDKEWQSVTVDLTIWVHTAVHFLPDGSSTCG